ncbi:Beta-lactamase hydrolase-like protein [Rhizobium rhizogenes]|uniref:Beta-lactamase hydrolase-like protein n=1 Tax=Rhizobium rhizogenes TaxID=359 RepID=A0AAN2DEJ5_RHIRH|nr:MULTISPECIES: bifunctional sulfur transferase/dioxygenase Blh [Rhizobium/Agrobacterium group]AQS65339.1 TIGR01244 family phosphatase [Rhizobium rhizogenes]MCZ7444312.1 bifunctional sulfur transferase/dioxygenase Blh [Rhizobium rhizogenes]NSZ80837.1 TIGR01244 family phosphatase [Agrobacterium tumefaciens]OAM61757.1 TIGR01244 family protein [Rhizobium rhizogenes]CAD0215136.1 Beta-lactamase hydrolase-like protein [Rhizobium rhizogenes]
MNAVKIDGRLTVAGQPEIADFSSLSAQGYKSIINARPDGEDHDQPGNMREKSAAGTAGLAYSFIPVTGPTMTEADIRAFQQAMAEADGPIFAHCKGGTRALTLYVLGEALDGRIGQDQIEAFGTTHGFDLSGAVRWLQRRAAALPQVKAFFDPRTWSVQYVVSDPATGRCAIIDPVYDFDEKSGATDTMNADAILAYIESQGLSVEWILDTHPHADHFSAAHYLKQKTGAQTAIGAKVTGVQKLWQEKYNWPELETDGSQWDRLFEAGDRFTIGSLDARVLFSPGHTLASVTYVVGDAAFVHDTLFMPDSGTARADFPGGSARELWASIQAILALSDETRLFTGHDYQPGGRAPKWESTVGEQKRSNPHLADMTEEGFIRLREARDRGLPMPKLILHALQVNIRGGRLPEPEANGKRYLKFPLDGLEGSTW